MLRTLSALALALALAVGGAAVAQQASSTAGATDAAAEPDASPSEGTELKGVYSNKSMLGISTGQADDEEGKDSAEDTNAVAGDQDDARASE